MEHELQGSLRPSKICYGIQLITMEPSDFDYDVALSFAGEDREFVDPIASLLKRRQVNVFYDAFEQGALWGKDLYQHFSKVYFERSRFFVPFLSQNYAAKKWTIHELRNAQARAFQQTRQEYILPIRLDDTEIPGILPTIGHLTYHNHTPEQIVDLILEKLDQSGRSTVDLHQSQPVPFRGKIPKIRKTFTQREKDLFIQESFSHVMTHFENGLKALEGADSDVVTSFEPINRSKFLCTIYVKGEVANRCKIWTGTGSYGRENQISFYNSENIDPHVDNSTTDALSISDDGYRLILERQGFHSVYTSEKAYGGTPEEAAEYLWERFVEPLDQRR